MLAAVTGAARIGERESGRSERLTAEQAALRRIATLVAGEAAPTQSSSRSPRGGQTIGARAASLARFDEDGTGDLCRCVESRAARLRSRSARAHARGDGDLAAVRDTGEPQRIDRYDDLGRAGRRALHELRLRLRRRRARSSSAGRSGARSSRPEPRGAAAPGGQRSAGSRTSPSSSRRRWRTRTRTGSSRTRARGSSRRATPSGAGWSATCTTAPSSGSSRWRSSCGSSGTCGRDPRPRSAADRGSDELGHALDELRELARGIHPAALTDRGSTPRSGSRRPRTVPVDVRHCRRTAPPNRSRPRSTTSSRRRSRTSRSTRRRHETTSRSNGSNGDRHSRRQRRRHRRRRAGAAPVSSA